MPPLSVSSEGALEVSVFAQQRRHCALTPFSTIEARGTSITRNLGLWNDAFSTPLLLSPSLVAVETALYSISGKCKSDASLSRTHLHNAFVQCVNETSWSLVVQQRLAMVTTAEERLAFDVQWKDPRTDVTWKYQLYLYPACGEIEMVSDD